MSISLCMIVKDEKKRALKAISNLDPYVSEKIIIDTGSTDGTAEALSERGCNVYHFPWCDDYSKARNESLKYATGDWILILDADEKLDIKSLKEIVRLSNGPKDRGYLAAQKHYVLNQYLTNYFLCTGEYPLEEIGYPGYYQSSVCRLFPRNDKIFFTGRIHEIVEPQMIASGFNVENSSIVVHHYGNVEHIRKEKKKAETYIRMLKIKATESPDWKVFYDIGLELMTADINRPTEAEEYFTESLKHIETEAVYINRGLLYLRAQRFDLAKKDFIRAIEIFPESTAAVHWLSELAKEGH